jgi:hypothetical protein
MHFKKHNLFEFYFWKTIFITLLSNSLIHKILQNIAFKIKKTCNEKIYNFILPIHSNFFLSK